MAGGAKSNETNGLHIKYIGASRFKKGWNRFAKCQTLFDQTGTHGIQTTPMSFFINIRRIFNENPPESHFLIFGVAQSNIVFKPVLDLSIEKLITKIRIYNGNENEKKVGFMDLYYNSDKTNDMIISFSNRIVDKQYNWSFLDASIIIPNTPTDLSGTILAEHTFKANSWLDGPDTWPLT